MRENDKPRILLMGAPYEVSNYKSRALGDCFAATGFNTGNLLIGHGLVSQLEFSNLAPYTYSMTPEFIEENFDQVAIAAANFLHPKFDFTPLSSILDKVKLPVFMVGLGAQLPTTGSVLKDIPEGTWRLVHIAAERSATIGVRGYFTADLLSKSGVKNVRVTGCPSLYTGLKSAIRIKHGSGRPERVVVNGSRNVVGHASDKAAATLVEKELFRVAHANGYPYVLQNEQPEMQIALGENLGAHAVDIAGVSKFFGLPESDVVGYYREFGKVFFSVSDWFDWIKSFDLSIGTRFHGNMAALLNGIPGLVLVHDSRTRELCEFAAIPHAFINDMTSLDVEKLYAEARYDLFEERYNALHRKYIEFMNENSIQHKLVAGVDLPPRGRVTIR